MEVVKKRERLKMRDFREVSDEMKLVGKIGTENFSSLYKKTLQLVTLDHKRIWKSSMRSQRGREEVKITSCTAKKTSNQVWISRSTGREKVVRSDAVHRKKWK